VDEFIHLLEMHGIALLTDIRTIPHSRHNPQFEQEALAQALEARHIGYRHMKALGGLRHPRKDSQNEGWRNGGFRGYADYMQTDGFRHALDDLIMLGRRQPVAIMCAESVPWRCHRSLVADALAIRHISVYHIFPDGKATPHQLTSFAHVDGQRITYPAAQPVLL